MNEHKRILYLISIMAVVGIVAAGVAVKMLYDAAFEEQKARLVETVQSRASIIEAIARFDAAYSKDYPGGSEAATLGQVIDAHENFEGFGETGEFTMARREGGQIVFLLSHRHHDLDKPNPVPVDSDLAEPMRRALSGRSGSLVGLDYRGEKVLAAHEAVDALGLGLVAKIDLSEVRAPFVRAAAMAGGAGVVFLAVGSLLFLRVSDPLVRRLRKYSGELERLVDERTRELAEANMTLKAENEERMQAEEALRRSETNLMKAQEVAHIGSWHLDLVENNLAWTDEVYRIFEIPRATPVTYESFLGLVHPEEREYVEKEWAAALEGSPYDIEHRVLVGDRVKWVREKAELYFDDDGNPVSGTGIVQDITERKKLEEEVIKAQKLESLGVLAGGIAHDFNNLLTGILGNISLLSHKVGKTGELFDRLAEVEKASLNARKLTEQLLTFSRGGAPVKEVIRLGELLEEATAFALRGSNVKRDLDIDDDLLPAEVDSGQINQVVSNLVINAKQAMPGGGTVRVRSRNIDVGPDGDPRLKPGPYVVISVEDHGVGIEEDNLLKIFDPYFTTKQDGSGLGLASAYSIIRKHGGHIGVDSEPGEGTVFSVYLPAAVGNAGPEAGETAPAAGKLTL